MGYLWAKDLEDQGNVDNSKLCLAVVKYFCFILALICPCIMHTKATVFSYGWLSFISVLVAELRALGLQTGFFTLRQIKSATNNFDPANKIGEGGFGPVYKVAMVLILELSSLLTLRKTVASAKEMPCFQYSETLFF